MYTEKRTLYEIIGVPKFSDDDVIVEACLRLAEKYRPDKNPGDPVAAHLFQELERAFAILCDPAKRAAYEASLLDAHLTGNDQASLEDAPGNS